MKNLNEIFEVKYGNQFDLNKMKITSSKEESVNFVSRTAKNNGVSARVMKLNNTQPHNAGCITIALGGSVLSSFVQADKFYTGQNVAVLTNNDLSLKEKLYYCLAIRSNAYRYQACGREANRTLGQLPLPSVSEIPEWVNNLKIENPQEAFKPMLSPPPPQPNINKWRKFKYKDLFSIGRGKGPRKKDLTGNGNTLFISASIQNNGLTGWTSHDPIHNENVITVVRNGNSVASAFFQERKFCSTEDVHIFEPKFEINRYIALFICTLIRKEKYRFNYGRKWSIGRMLESEIQLPVTKMGVPDYLYMEKYIKSLPYSGKIKV